MIIQATNTKRRPKWYVRHVMFRCQLLAANNPGFHRFVIHFTHASPYETGWLIDPSVEPEMRRLLRRVLVLQPPVEDDDPWVSV